MSTALQEVACLAAFVVGVPAVVTCFVASAREGARAAAAHAAATATDQEVTG